MSAFYYSKHKSISKSSTHIHGNKLYSLLTSIRTSFVIFPSRIHNTKQVTWSTQSTNSCAWFTGLRIANECGKEKNKHTQRRVGDANFDYARDYFSKKKQQLKFECTFLSAAFKPVITQAIGFFKILMCHFFPTLEKIESKFRVPTQIFSALPRASRLWLSFNFMIFEFISLFLKILSGFLMTCFYHKMISIYIYIYIRRMKLETVKTDCDKDLFNFF